MAQSFKYLRSLELVSVQSRIHSGLQPSEVDELSTVQFTMSRDFSDETLKMKSCVFFGDTKNLIRYLH